MVARRGDERENRDWRMQRERLAGEMSSCDESVCGCARCDEVDDIVA